MILRSPTEHENADHRHAGMDGRHPGSQDASGDIRVGLDSSSPCWNDVIEKVLELTEAPPGRIFKGGREACPEQRRREHEVRN
jgi:hypothetical protein